MGFQTLALRFRVSEDTREPTISSSRARGRGARAVPGHAFESAAALQQQRRRRSENLPALRQLRAVRREHPDGREASAAPRARAEGQGRRRVRAHQSAEQRGPDGRREAGLPDLRVQPRLRLERPLLGHLLHSGEKQQINYISLSISLSLYIYIYIYIYCYI